jgi:lysozyme family protein
MNFNWEKSFKLMLSSEGGYVDHPSDPGGRTNLGVTQAVWENWIGHVSGEKEMRSLTPEMVKPIYKKKYWDACRCDELPSGVDYLVFDFAVNAGVGRSIKTLQKVFGVTIDGAIGPKTLQAVTFSDANDLIKKFSDEKVRFYQSLPTFSVFGKGWLNRVERVKAEAFSMANE